MSKEELERELESKKQLIRDKLQATGRTMEEMKEIGNGVNVELYSQGEKLKRINDKMDQADSNVQYGNYITSGMKSFWTRMKQKITGGFKHKPGESFPAQPVFEEKLAPSSSANNIVSSTRKKGQDQEYTAEDDIIDSHLDRLCEQADELKNIMKLTGQALDTQSKQIKVINSKADKVNKDIVKGNRNMKYLLS